MSTGDNKTVSGIEKGKESLGTDEEGLGKSIPAVESAARVLWENCVQLNSSMEQLQEKAKQKLRAVKRNQVQSNHKIEAPKNSANEQFKPKQKLNCPDNYMIRSKYEIERTKLTSKLHKLEAISRENAKEREKYRIELAQAKVREKVLINRAFHNSPRVAIMQKHQGDATAINTTLQRENLRAMNLTTLPTLVGEEVPHANIAVTSIPRTYRTQLPVPRRIHRLKLGSQLNNCSLEDIPKGDSKLEEKAISDIGSRCMTHDSSKTTFSNQEATASLKQTLNDAKLIRKGHGADCPPLNAWIKFTKESWKLLQTRVKSLEIPSKPTQKTLSLIRSQLSSEKHMLANSIAVLHEETIGIIRKALSVAKKRKDEGMQLEEQTQEEIATLKAKIELLEGDKEKLRRELHLKWQTTARTSIKESSIGDTSALAAGASFPDPMVSIGTQTEDLPYYVSEPGQATKEQQNKGRVVKDGLKQTHRRELAKERGKSFFHAKTARILHKIVRELNKTRAVMISKGLEASSGELQYNPTNREKNLEKGEITTAVDHEGEKDAMKSFIFNNVPISMARNPSLIKSQSGKPFQALKTYNDSGEEIEHRKYREEIYSTPSKSANYLREQKKIQAYSDSKKTNKPTMLKAINGKIAMGNSYSKNPIYSFSLKKFPSLRNFQRLQIKAVNVAHDVAHLQENIELAEKAIPTHSRHEKQIVELRDILSTVVTEKNEIENRIASHQESLLKNSINNDKHLENFGRYSYNLNAEPIEVLASTQQKVSSVETGNEKLHHEKPSSALLPSSLEANPHRNIKKMQDSQQKDGLKSNRKVRSIIGFKEIWSIAREAKSSPNREMKALQNEEYNVYEKSPMHFEPKAASENQLALPNRIADLKLSIEETEKDIKKFEDALNGPMLYNKLLKSTQLTNAKLLATISTLENQVQDFEAYSMDLRYQNTELLKNFSGLFEVIEVFTSTEADAAIASAVSDKKEGKQIKAKRPGELPLSIEKEIIVNAKEAEGKLQILMEKNEKSRLERNFQEKLRFMENSFENKHKDTIIKYQTKLAKQELEAAQKIQELQTRIISFETGNSISQANESQENLLKYNELYHTSLDVQKKNLEDLVLQSQAAFDRSIKNEKLKHDQEIKRIVTEYQLKLSEQQSELENREKILQQECILEKEEIVAAYELKLQTYKDEKEIMLEKKLLDANKVIKDLKNRYFVDFQASKEAHEKEKINIIQQHSLELKKYHAEFQQNLHYEESKMQLELKETIQTYEKKILQYQKEAEISFEKGYNTQIQCYERQISRTNEKSAAYEKELKESQSYSKKLGQDLLIYKESTKRKTKELESEIKLANSEKKVLLEELEVNTKDKERLEEELFEMKLRQNTKHTQNIGIQTNTYSRDIGTQIDEIIFETLKEYHSCINNDEICTNNKKLAEGFIETIEDTPETTSSRFSDSDEENSQDSTVTDGSLNKTKKLHEEVDTELKQLLNRAYPGKNQAGEHAYKKVFPEFSSTKNPLVEQFGLKNDVESSNYLSQNKRFQVPKSKKMQTKNTSVNFPAPEYVDEIENLTSKKDFHYCNLNRKAFELKTHIEQEKSCVEKLMKDFHKLDKIAENWSKKDNEYINHNEKLKGFRDLKDINYRTLDETKKFKIYWNY